MQRAGSVKGPAEPFDCAAVEATQKLCQSTCWCVATGGGQLYVATWADVVGQVGRAGGCGGQGGWEGAVVSSDAVGMMPHPSSSVLYHEASAGLPVSCFIAMHPMTSAECDLLSAGLDDHRWVIWLA